MTVAAQILTDIANLQRQVVAAAPLSSAGPATIRSIQLNAITTLNDILANLDTAAGDLDLLTMPLDPAAIRDEVLLLLSNAKDQSYLASAYGYIARSLTSLNQIPGKS